VKEQINFNDGTRLLFNRVSYKAIRLSAVYSHQFPTRTAPTNKAGRKQKILKELYEHDPNHAEFVTARKLLNLNDRVPVR